MIDAERQRLIDLIASSHDPSEIARLCREFALRQNILVSDGNGGLIAADESSRAEARVPEPAQDPANPFAGLPTDPSFMKFRRK